MRLILENGLNQRVINPNVLINQLSNFNQKKDKYITLVNDASEYIQSIKTPQGRYILEFKNSLSELYVSKRDDLTIEKIVKIFNDYYNGNDSWKDQIQLEHIKLFPYSSSKPKIKLNKLEQIDEALKNCLPINFKFLFDSFESQNIHGAIFFLSLALFIYIIK
jgi:hypothetical protein